MPGEAYELVKEIHERFAAGDRDHWRRCFAEDVVWDTTRSDAPDARLYRGHDGVEEYFRTWLGTWEDFSLELRELVDAGDSVVAVWSNRGRGKGSGIEAEHEFYAVYDVRDGKVVRFRMLASRDEALQAAGLA